MASDDIAIIVPGSTNLVELEGSQDRVTKGYPSDATVTGVLNDATGTPVAGAGSLSLAYVAGTAGKKTLYRATIPHTVSLTTDASYTLVVTETWSGVVRVFTRDCVAKTQPD